MSSPVSDGIVNCSTAAFSFCLSTADVCPLSISIVSIAPIVPEAHGEGKVSDGRAIQHEINTCETPSSRLLHLRSENGLGVARSKTTARVRRTGLDEYRPTLRTAREVQRPGHAVIGAFVVDGLNAFRVGVSSASAIIQLRIVRPAIP